MTIFSPISIYKNTSYFTVLSLIPLFYFLLSSPKIEKCQIMSICYSLLFFLSLIQFTHTKEKEVPKLYNILLSQNAKDALDIIYKTHLSNSSSPYKIFHICSLFHDTDNPDIMLALIELSKNKFIRLFSDKRLILRSEAITYLENTSSNHAFHQTYFAT